VPFLDPGSASLADRAVLWSAVGLAIVVAKGISGVYATYVQALVAGDVGATLRLGLLDALLSRGARGEWPPRHRDHGGEVCGPPVVSPSPRAEDASDADRAPLGEGVAALTERVHEIEHGLKQGFLGGLRAVAQLAPLAALLVLLSPRTAAVALLLMGTFGLLLGRVRAGYRAAATRAGRERALLLEAADESVRHAELWVSYGAEGKARRRLAELGQAIVRRASHLDARAAALSGANEVLGAAALLVAIVASRSNRMGGGPDGATLLAFAVAFFMAYRPVRDLGEARLALDRAAAAYSELQPILARGKEAGAGPRPELRAPRGERWDPAVLEVRALRLARGGSAAVTMRVEPGSIVVLTGPTGIGKTTLLRTLLGFERESSGDVLYGGRSLLGAPPGPAGRPFVWVPQDAPLLADSLDANVGLGWPAASSGATRGSASGSGVRSVLEPLGAGHLAGALSGARLGGGGRAVSGGERQWIALARALATNQPVLLLDEPTSGLDAEAQKRVLDAVASLRGRRTVILVTHRPEPLAIADVVVRLDRGGTMEDAA
jgi:ABC-type multidrug transport system fused ATPase/permease subunit